MLREKCQKLQAEVAAKQAPGERATVYEPYYDDHEFEETFDYNVSRPPVDENFPEKYDKTCLLGDMMKAFKLSPKRYGSLQRITDMHRDAERREAERREAEQREAEDYFANSQVEVINKSMQMRIMRSRTSRCFSTSFVMSQSFSARCSAVDRRPRSKPVEMNISVCIYSSTTIRALAFTHNT
jgi:hypothetical protein